MNTIAASGMGGKILCMGDQRIRATLDDVERLAILHGYKLTRIDPDPQPLDRYLTADEFFRLLGFESYDALDNSDYEGARVIHDLNDPNVPDNLKGQFDVVYDGGTLEHVFNVPVAMMCMGEFLNSRGFIIHDLPVNNYVDHGFYQFSPTLFWHYYGLNGFQLHESVLIQHTDNVLDPMVVVPHHVPETNAYTRKMGDLAYGIHFVARKTPVATSGRMPVQSKYMNAWDIGMQIDFDEFTKTLNRYEAYAIRLE